MNERSETELFLNLIVYLCKGVGLFFVFVICMVILLLMGMVAKGISTETGVPLFVALGGVLAVGYAAYFAVLLAGFWVWERCRRWVVR